MGPRFLAIQIVHYIVHYTALHSALHQKAWHNFLMPMFLNPFPRKLSPSPKPAVNTHFLTTRSCKAGPLVAAAAAGFELQMLARPAALALLASMLRPGRR